MRDNQLYCILDYETRSEAVLRTQGKNQGVGAWEYAIHPTTKILCAAWKVGTRETLRKAKTKIWEPWRRQHLGDLYDVLKDRSIMIVAHNAYFEQVITQHVFFTKIDSHRSRHPKDWICTASLAATHALPRNLEGACEVLDLAVKKDLRGKLLIRRHCIPRKPSKKNPSIWNDDPQGLKELGEYCITDVNAETELFLTLPPLQKRERRIWVLNQEINLRGVHVDRTLVTQALKLIDAEEKNHAKEFHEITGGELRISQRAKVLDLLSDKGLTLPNLQKKTIEDALESGLAKGIPKRILEIRQSSSKTSTKKYQAFEVRTRSDSRLRDLVMYHGASTGRDTGTGVQPHNFPRGTLGDLTELAVDAIREGHVGWLRAIAGDPMAALSSCLRGCITATPGFELFSADYAGIELRVIFWLANHHKGLKALREGLDLYLDQARHIFGRSVMKGEVIQGVDARQLGKVTVLGAGFGLGAEGFLRNCLNQNITITLDLAKKSISSYRSNHQPVTKLWENYERAAVAAVKEPGMAFKVNRTRWFVKDKFLYCELPSGRKLAYYNAHIKMEERFNQMRPVLRFWGVNPVTKKWARESTWGGKLTENVVQAVARDLMVGGQLRTYEAGYIPLFSVHDELVNERKKGDGDLDEFFSLMEQGEPWSEGLPIKVEGWKGERYRK